jgi:hypothetical protein
VPRRRGAEPGFRYVAAIAVSTLALCAVRPAGTAAGGTPDPRCGPECLTFCARLLGHEADEEDVVRAAGGSRRGTSLAVLEAVARRMGLEARCCAMRLGHLRRLSSATPGIAHVDGNHFVVVWAAGRRVVVVEPEGGIEEVTFADFGHRWDGRIMVVSRPGEQAAWWHGRVWGLAAAVGFAGAAAVALRRGQRRGHAPQAPAQRA